MVELNETTGSRFSVSRCNLVEIERLHQALRDGDGGQDADSRNHAARAEGDGQGEHR